jgi:RimJ/RimL family protein N-acetyltransferase
VPLLVDPALPAGTLRGITQPRLATNNGLVLRPWRQDDAEAVLTAFACPEIQQWHVRRLDSLEEAVEWVGQWGDRWQTETAASWAIVADADAALPSAERVSQPLGQSGQVLGQSDRPLRDVDQPLGQIGLRNVSLAEGSASLSYWVTPAARGRSLAARSVEALTVWAFEVIGFNRLNIQHSSVNTASCRVAERTGYRAEGTLRQAIKHADGWHDWHLHGRLRADT